MKKIDSQTTICKLLLSICKSRNFLRFRSCLGTKKLCRPTRNAPTIENNQLNIICEPARERSMQSDASIYASRNSQAL
uniref:hypothetical protein n=1 Tax=Prevotella sp. TaxID=59823 RepID=UPI004029AE18